MMTIYNPAIHGDIRYNRDHWFLWNGSQVLTSDDPGEITDAVGEMLYGCVRHHTALRRNYEFGGYVPVAETRIFPYHGRFGEGYTEIRNYSSQYVAVTYWIRKAA